MKEGKSRLRISRFCIVESQVAQGILTHIQPQRFIREAVDDFDAGLSEGWRLDRLLPQIDGQVDLVFIDITPAQFIAGHVMSIGLLIFKNQSVVVNGCVDVTLIEVIVAKNQPALKAEVRFRILLDQIVVRFDHLCKVAQLTKLMRNEELDFIVIYIVWELRNNAAVDRYGLVFEQAGFRGDDGLFVVGTGFFKDAEVHEA